MSTSSATRAVRIALLTAIAGTTCIFATADCTAVFRPAEPEPYVEPEVVYVASPPDNYETSPREYYGGSVVYLVGGRWYRRSGDRWQSYRTEPVELRRSRTSIERGYHRPAAAEHRERH